MKNVMSIYKSYEENFNETLDAARTMTTAEIHRVLRDRLAFHGWYVKALEQALKEKEAAG